MTQQAVTKESDVADKQTTDEESAQDELDSLLNEFDKETKQDEQPLTDLAKRTEHMLQIQQARIDEEDIGRAIGTIKESISDLDGVKSDLIIRGIMEAEAARDTRIKDAFASRDRNPKAWQAAIKKIAQTLREEMSVDTKATDDRKAVTAAVQSAQTKQADTTDLPDFSKMTDTEFALWKAKNG